MSIVVICEPNIVLLIHLDFEGVLDIYDLSKVHHRSLNLYCRVIPVPKLTNRSFRSSNLFICVILVPKLVQLCHPGP
jgi:hypothetical protein